jgi:ABC-2 type transport system permease protein
VPRERTGRLVLALTARRAVRSGAIWGAVFGLSVAVTAIGYNATFPDEASRQKLAASFGPNAGIAALLGPARRLDTVAGFTAWRTMGILMIIGAVWGLLTATRLTRGEEDAGRWELVLAGPVTKTQAAARTVGGLGAGWLAMWLVTVLVTIAVGRSPDVDFSVSAAVFYATALCTSAALFLAVGVLAGQLAANRRQANLLGTGILGVSFLLRMVADASSGLSALRWVSPLGWIQELRPLTGSRPLVLVLIAALIGVLGVVSVQLAGQRDLGAGALPERDARPPRLALLGGQLGLTARLSLPAGLSWIGGLAVLGLVLGLVAQSAAEAVQGSTVIDDVIGRLGGDASGASAYLGLTFVFAAALLAFAAAGHVGAAHDEEADGRLDNLLVRPVARRRWLAGRLGVATIFVAVAAASMGVMAWVGAASQHTGVGFDRLLTAGVNIVPPALLVLGVGSLLFGLWPRLAVPLTYGLVAWSFLVELIGSIVTTNHWLLDASLIHHMAPAPAADPRWSSALVMIAIGVVAGGAGAIAFDRRDLVSA